MGRGAPFFYWLPLVGCRWLHPFCFCVAGPEDEEAEAFGVAGVLQSGESRCWVRERGITLDTALAKIGANNSTDLSKKELFRILDRDGNGNLDLQEFDRLYNAIRAQTKRELWEKTRTRKTGDSWPCSTGCCHAIARALSPPPHRPSAPPRGHRARCVRRHPPRRQHWAHLRSDRGDQGDVCDADAR